MTTQTQRLATVLRGLPITDFATIKDVIDILDRTALAFLDGEPTPTLLEYQTDGIPVTQVALVAPAPNTYPRYPYVLVVTTPTALFVRGFCALDGDPQDDDGTVAALAAFKTAQVILGRNGCLFCGIELDETDDRLFSYCATCDPR